MSHVDLSKFYRSRDASETAAQKERRERILEDYTVRRRILDESLFEETVRALAEIKGMRAKA